MFHSEVVKGIDHLGRNVRTLTHAMTQPGRHEVIWDGTNDRGECVTSGIYFYRLRTPSRESTKKVLRLK